MKWNRHLAAAFLTAVLVLGTGAIPAHAEEPEAAAASVPAETAAEEQLLSVMESTEPETAIQSATETTEASDETVTETATEETAATEIVITEAVTETETAAAAGWQTKNGKRYYFNENGEPTRGEAVIDGIPYLFGYSGAQKTDWQTIGGKRYYYNPKTGEAVIGWFTYFGNSYYISTENGKLTGAQEIAGKRCRFAENGELLAGMFQTADGTRGFAEADGTVFAGVHESADGRILTDADGLLLTGIVQLDGCYYYADAGTGLLYSGLLEVNGERYYIDPETGSASAGLHTAEETDFFTDETGRLLSGWQETDGKRYFISEETFSVQYGLFEADNAWYFGTPDGLATGLQEVEGEWIPFDETTGMLQTGWFIVGEQRYYLNAATRRLCRNSFFQIGDNVYYFDAQGAAATGLKTISGALYAFDAEGARLTGLQTLDGTNYYYFDPENGYACTGVKQIEGGTIRLGKDGRQIFGWHEVDGELYYTDPYTGFVKPGQQNINGNYCQFDTEGKMIPELRLYNQKDDQWAQVQFDSRKDANMKASACGIFSFCNAIYALNQRKADAVEVAYWAINVGAYDPVEGTTRKIFYDNVEQQYGESLNFTLGGQYWGGISDTLLQNHLLSGGVAVIHVKGHFMAVVGYDPSTGLYHVLESYESNTRGLQGDSWVDAYKMSSGNTNVDWYVLISKRYEDGSSSPGNTSPEITPQPDPPFPELF